MTKKITGISNLLLAIEGQARFVRNLIDSNKDKEEIKLELETLLYYSKNLARYSKYVDKDSITKETK